MKCFPVTLLTIQVSVPLQVALFWHEGLFLATADGNSLTTERRELLETPAVPDTGVKHTPRALTFLSVHWNTQALATEEIKGCGICPRSWNVLGHSQSADLKGNCSGSGNGLKFSHFCLPLWRPLPPSLYLWHERLPCAFIINHFPHLDFWSSYLWLATSYIRSPSALANGMVELYFCNSFMCFLSQI